jgi:ribosomal protein S6/ribosomal protein S18
MIYETAFVVRPDASEEVVNGIKTSLSEVFKQFGAEVLVNDSWGVKTFAQPTESGLKKGAYHYFMYRGAGDLNAEIERRYRINENMVRFIIVKLGEDKHQADIVKKYKNPNHSTVAEGEMDDEGGFGGDDKDKKMHSKRKSCWFSAKKTSPDWKDPKSYAWLVNEFGKISPARITGLTPTFQRRANESIKRGRNMLLISYQSNEIAR